MSRYLLISIFMLFAAYDMHAQEIKASVTVNMEQLTFEYRNNVASMQSDVESYINNQKFTDVEWEGDKIPVDINIYLSGGANNRYSGRLLVVSRRDLDGPKGEGGQSVTLKMMDPLWEFNYNLGASFSFNTMRYDEFITLIDYYMLLVIGFDQDTYGELDGSRTFDKAKSIVQLGASADGTGFEKYPKPGEFTRLNLVNELTDLRYEPLRKLFFSYYVDGLDKMAFNKDEALTALENVIKDMFRFKQEKVVSPSVLFQAFFDTKAQEIASIFNGYRNDKIFDYLKSLDPGNTMLWEDAKNGKVK